MKFVALALAIILATGCQARSLQADAPPSEYEHMRAAVVTYLGQVKEGALRAINHLDDAEFKDYKQRLTQSVDNIQHMLESASESLSTVRQGLGPQIVQAFSTVRDTVKHDIEELQKELEPKREELRQVVKKHLDEYREKLEPLLKEYSDKHREQLGEFKVKLEPVMKELQERIKVNVEETKSKLTPIVEIIRNKLTKQLEDLKAKYGDYFQEYRDYIESNAGNMRSKYESGELQKKLKELSEELKPQFTHIYETIWKAFAV